MALQLPTQFSEIDENRAAQIANALQAEEDGTAVAAEPAAEELPAAVAADDGAPEEIPASAEPKTSTTEPVAEPAIEPPLSWTAEEKATFGELPPHVQKVIARRESERERATQTRLQEATEKSKAIEQERLRLAREADTYVQLAQMADPIIAEGNQTDWAKFARENPAECQARYHEYQQRVGMLNRAMQQRQAAVDEQRRETYERSRSILAERVPEWSDQAKFKEGSSTLYRLASDRYGFSPEELHGLVDYRSILVLRDAAAYHDLMARQAKSPAPATKRVVETARTIRPGAADEQGASERENAKAIRQQAMKTRDPFKKAELLAKLV